MIVWTYDLSETAYSIIETSCSDDEFGWPNLDARGVTMFENTHFRTEAGAWNRLVANAEAMLNRAATEYRQAKVALEKATRQLAATADVVERVRRERIL